MDHTASQESFLTVAEVAETLKLNQQTVRNWIDQGSLPAVRVGRRVRIRQSDFDQLLEQGSRAGASPTTQAASPSAADFWGGEPVGRADPGPDGQEDPRPDGQEDPGSYGRADPGPDGEDDPE